MSNEPGEEEAPPGAASSGDEFDFYFQFTKPLVLDLPTPEDRAVAAAWVQKLEEEPQTEEDKRLRLDYLKLFLFVLQSGRLSGIFRKQPPSGPLQPFPQGFSMADMGNLMIDQDELQTCGGGDARLIPYTIEISNDLRELVAAQEIPYFGVQMYYAWSADAPLFKWSLFDEDKFPQYILDKIRQLKEVKSDEKTGTKSCGGKKKACDLPLVEKYSKKKVKSPQEIERSQGRSYHTYVGLMGRMGNGFKDNDQDKYKTESTRTKCPKKTASTPKRCAMNRENEDPPLDEDYENFLGAMGGYGGAPGQMGRCTCPSPYHSPNCETQAGPQPFEEQQPGRTCTIKTRSNNEAPYQQPQPVSKAIRRLNFPPEQFPESEDMYCTPLELSPSPRSKSNSPKRNPERPPSDNIPMGPNQGANVASSPPTCSCPCPRVSPQEMMQMRPRTCDEAGSGRTGQERNGGYMKQDNAGMSRRTGGTGYRTGRTASGNSGGRGSPVPNGGYGAGGAENYNTEVVHCYDPQNPDPTMTQNRQSTQPTWCPDEELEENEQDDTLICETDDRQQEEFAQAVRAHRAQPKSRSPKPQPQYQQQQQQQQQQAPCMSGTSKANFQMSSYPRIKQEGDPRAKSPTPLPPSSTCQLGPSSSRKQQQDSKQQLQWKTMVSSNQCQQNYGVFPLENEMNQKMRDFESKCPTAKTDICNRAQPSVSRPKNQNYSPGIFAVKKNSGKLCDLASVMEGLKMKTEAHREKCEAPQRKQMTAEGSSCQRTLQPKMYQENLQMYQDGMQGTCNQQKPRNMGYARPNYCARVSRKAVPTFSPIEETSGLSAKFPASSNQGYQQQQQSAAFRSPHIYREDRPQIYNSQQNRPQQEDYDACVEEDEDDECDSASETPEEASSNECLENDGLMQQQQRHLMPPQQTLQPNTVRVPTPRPSPQDGRDMCNPDPRSQGYDKMRNALKKKGRVLCSTQIQPSFFSNESTIYPVSGQDAVEEFKDDQIYCGEADAQDNVNYQSSTKYYKVYGDSTPMQCSDNADNDVQQPDQMFMTLEEAECGSSGNFRSRRRKGPSPGNNDDYTTKHQPSDQCGRANIFY